MQPQKAEQKAKQPRFRIEKLEERITPHHRLGHYPPGQCPEYDWYCTKNGAGHNKGGDT